ncbi:MAG: hypothetical protein LBJ67_07840 [Planctomycetaceae bacterium]|nr:hypothetical protein [Planctomycetaceae bacterium]
MRRLIGNVPIAGFSPSTTFRPNPRRECRENSVCPTSPFMAIYRVRCRIGLSSRVCFP